VPQPKRPPPPQARKIASAAKSLLTYSTLPPISRTVESDDGDISHYFFLRQEPFEYVAVVCSEDGVVLSKRRTWGHTCISILLVELSVRVREALAETEERH
jgi:hypothetical protein